jgi:hypothetical protein
MTDAGGPMCFRPVPPGAAQLVLDGLSAAGVIAMMLASPWPNGSGWPWPDSDTAVADLTALSWLWRPCEGPDRKSISICPVVTGWCC